MPIVPTGPRSGPCSFSQFAPPSPPPSKMRKSVENLFCDLCQISCSSALVIQQHLEGWLHEAKMNYMNMKRESTTAAKHGCDLCKICCCSEGNLQMHFIGQKHKGKAKAKGNDKMQEPIMCEMCGVSCMNQESFEHHIKGRKQNAKLLELQSCV